MTAPCPGCELFHDSGVDCFEGRMYDTAEELAEARRGVWWCDGCRSEIPHYDVCPPVPGRARFHDPGNDSLIPCGPVEHRPAKEPA